MSQEKNTEWLTMAMTKPFNYINERFFYDKINEEFFSTTLLDSVLINDELQGTFETSYTKEEIEKLTVKLKLLEKVNTSILEIPRLTVAERREIQIQYADSLDTLNADYLKRIIEQQDGKTEFIIDEVFKANPGFNALAVNWEDYKMQAAKKKISDYTKYHSINMERSSIWHISKERIIKKASNSQTPDLLPEKEKPWWKIW
ncbi:hypothetical protein [Rubrolithibacter danxiaensis]|uniref:hypothetical protein n=1 Tax=Rubrolithibacter danxiaensis TaxID=3390805 RepID=UPI003BF7F73A